MKYKLKAYSIYEFGQRKDAQGRPHQEDSIFPKNGELKDTDRLFILCDGMGGHDAGEVASATVCEAMSSSVLSHNDADSNFSNAMFQEALNAASDALDKKDTGAVKKMGTTMTFLKLHEKGCTIAHMGDSRVYHIRQGADAESTEIVSVTRDHSLVNDLIKAGELTEEEAKHSRQKNVITRALQPHMEVRPNAEVLNTVDVKPGDYFYLCSDGMLEEMDDDNIRYFFSEAAGTDEERVEKLRQSTKDNKDNHSAIIVHILDVEDPLPIPEDETQKMGSNVGEISDDATDNGDSEMVSLDRKPGGEQVAVGQRMPQGGNSAGRMRPQPKKKGNLFVVILAVILLLAVIIFGITQFLSSGKTKEKKVEKVTLPTTAEPQQQNAVTPETKEIYREENTTVRRKKVDEPQTRPQKAEPGKPAAKPGARQQNTTAKPDGTGKTTKAGEDQKLTQPSAGQKPQIPNLQKPHSKPEPPKPGKGNDDGNRSLIKDL